MATEICTPKNGMDMTEGTIVRWLKNEGDHVEKNEPVMEIETDKITMEAESPAEGILLKKLFEDGAVVPVLQVVAYVGEAGEAIPDAKTAPAPQAQEAPAPAARPSAVPAPDSPVAATPYARKLAKDRGVDLHDIPPGGRHGEIRGADVEAYLDAAPRATPLARAMAAGLGIDLKGVAGSGCRGKITSADLHPAPAAEQAAAVDAVVAELEAVIQRRKMTGMRKVIAQRMFSSHSEIPPVTQNIKIDVTDLLDLREKINLGREKGDKVSVNDMIVKAVAIVIGEQERFRMTLEGTEYVLHSRINVGVAVGLDEGLLVPVVRDVDKKGLIQLARETKELSRRARDGKLTPDDMGDGRITVSNIGMFGTHSFTPIINQPEAAIVGVCAAEDELVLADGQVTARKRMMICLTYDHRILNGTEACMFESRLKQLLENPVSILL